jgi:predicted nucleotidyltransferase
MKISQEIQSRINDFLNLCKVHKVKKLYAFGSSITDHYDEQASDIDLLVEIDDNDPLERGEKLISFWDGLEAFFQRKVDLLTNSSIKNPILRNNINRTKVLIYDGKGQKVFV